MRATLDFYVRVLRMPLVHALTTANTATHGKGAPPFRAIPHLFLDMGGDSLLAFFEYPKGAVGRASATGSGRCSTCRSPAGRSASTKRSSA
jgi:catechol 2,3-dioxygenase-like lactoylglutathione lyase family enzyme